LTYLRFLNYKLKSDHPGVCACVCQYFSVTVCEGQRDTSCNLSGHAQLFKFFFVALSALLLLSISIRRIPPGREITVVVFPSFDTYLLVHYLVFFYTPFLFFFMLVACFSPVSPWRSSPVEPSMLYILTVLSTAHLAPELAYRDRRTDTQKKHSENEKYVRSYFLTERRAICPPPLAMTMMMMRVH